MDLYFKKIANIFLSNPRTVHKAVPIAPETDALDDKKSEMLAYKKIKVLLLELQVQKLQARSSSMFHSSSRPKTFQYSQYTIVTYTKQE